ncbi:MAG TPA: M67 family metallopeptidase [Acidimicrobiales bacterium]|nr:M67 family metallopeptidase [Acidimicrobiales bacterium]
MLTLGLDQRDAMIAACVRALPNEGCGLLLGTSAGEVTAVVESPNVAGSARIYEIDPQVLLRTYRRADAEGVEVIGVFHSHTHSEAFPSPTDVKQAPDPAWHYVLISLRDPDAVVRSFRVLEGEVSEEPLQVREPSS